MDLIIRVWGGAREKSPLNSPLIISFPMIIIESSSYFLSIDLPGIYAILPRKFSSLLAIQLHTIDNQDERNCNNLGKEEFTSFLHVVWMTFHPGGNCFCLLYCIFSPECSFSVFMVDPPVPSSWDIFMKDTNALTKRFSIA